MNKSDKKKNNEENKPESLIASVNQIQDVHDYDNDESGIPIYWEMQENEWVKGVVKKLRFRSWSPEPSIKIPSTTFDRRTYQQLSSSFMPNKSKFENKIPPVKSRALSRFVNLYAQRTQQNISSITKSRAKKHDRARHAGHKTNLPIRIDADSENPYKNKAFLDPNISYTGKMRDSQDEKIITNVMKN